MDSQKDFFGGASHPALKFAAIGDGYKGTLIDTPAAIQRPNLDGELEWQLPVNMLVDGEKRTLWIRAMSKMSRAVREAYTDAGAAGLEEGGTLTIAWESTESPKTVGHSPSKVYRAKYAPPAAAAGAEETAERASSIFDD